MKKFLMTLSLFNMLLFILCCGSNVQSKLEEAKSYLDNPAVDASFSELGFESQEAYDAASDGDKREARLVYNSNKAKEILLDYFEDDKITLKESSQKLSLDDQQQIVVLYVETLLGGQRVSFIETAVSILTNGTGGSEGGDSNFAVLASVIPDEAVASEDSYNLFITDMSLAQGVFDAFDTLVAGKFAKSPTTSTDDEATTTSTTEETDSTGLTDDQKSQISFLEFFLSISTTALVTKWFEKNGSLPEGSSELFLESIDSALAAIGDAGLADQEITDTIREALEETDDDAALVEQFLQGKVGTSQSF